MINSINFYSSGSSYGKSSNYSYAPVPSGGNYLDSLFNVGMQMLLIAMAKQQLQVLAKDNSGTTSEEEGADDAPLDSDDGDNQGVNYNNESSCHCVCPEQDARSEEEEPEPDEVQVLQEMIQQLQQQAAYQKAMQQTDQFKNYMATSFSDRQTIRSIEIEGGKVLRQYDDHFLAEDQSGNRYTVSRSPSFSFYEK